MSMRQLKITASITNRESESIDKYLREIGKLELLSPEEEMQLAIAAKQGNKAATDRLVKANLRFVVSVAKQFQYKGISLADLINEGNIGLIKAVNNFDPTRGFKFISYAVWWIRQQIIHAVAEHSTTIRVPLNKLGWQRKIEKANLLLEQKLERPATEEELAEELNMDTGEVKLILSYKQHHISLDTTLNEDSDESMIDLVKNPNATDTDKQVEHDESLKFEIQRSLQILNERQKETICLFFGIGVDHPLGLEDIAHKFYLTPERVRQIKDKAIEILKSSGSMHLLRSYLAA